jgi:hypothetical protein
MLVPFVVPRTPQFVARRLDAAEEGGAGLATTDLAASGALSILGSLTLPARF